MSESAGPSNTRTEGRFRVAEGMRPHALCGDVSMANRPIERWRERPARADFIDHRDPAVPFAARDRDRAAPLPDGSGRRRRPMARSTPTG